MATTAAETASASGTKPETRRTRRRSTTLDDHIDKPSVVEPGDAPFDTTDPDERATSVSPDKAAAARAGFGTVNAAIPLPQPQRHAEPQRDTRWETSELVGPDGKLVTVKRNIETGESEIG